jgi:hypothetical protein
VCTSELLRNYPHHREVVAGRHRARRQVFGIDLGGLHVEQPDVPETDLSRHPATADDRNRFAVLVQPDPPAEEQVHLAGIADREETGVLEEERPLLGEEQVEAIEVHLLIVDLDLREVGVDGPIERQAGRQVVLGVDADVAVGIGLDGIDA